jgi:hypothetical protein
MAKTSIRVMIECKSSLGIARLKNEVDSTDGNATFSVNIHAGIDVLQGAIGTKIEHKKEVKHKKKQRRISANSRYIGTVEWSRPQHNIGSFVSGAALRIKVHVEGIKMHEKQIKNWNTSPH